MRIYLDNCCYNRPYDEQFSTRIQSEVKAILQIQNEIKLGNIELATSYIMNYENERNPFFVKKLYIETFMNRYATVYVDAQKAEHVKELAKSIIKTGVKEYDAYHVICAVISKCDYFLTTDDKLLKHGEVVIKLVNPIEFLKIYGGKQ